MNEKIKYIALPKLFLWIEPERFEIYPKALSKVIIDKTYSKKEILSDLFELIIDNSGKFLRSDKARNSFGLEKISNNKLSINGINLFKLSKDKNYLVNEEALLIGKNFLNSKEEDDWLYPFIRHIAKYEIRTRLLLLLLGKENWCLTFKNSDFFSFPAVKAKLIKEEEFIELFTNNGEKFNILLSENKDIALGKYWKQEILNSEYDLLPDFEFSGSRETSPSTNDLCFFIKCSLFLLKYVGILISKKGGWIVDTEKALEILGNEIASDFITFENVVEQNSLLELKNIVDEIKDNQGFVVTSYLAKKWSLKNSNIEDYENSFDQFIRENIYNQKIQIIEKNQGQPRHGRGLFGDENARKIKIGF